jgi:hypothetical protein
MYVRYHRNDVNQSKTNLLNEILEKKTHLKKEVRNKINVLLIPQGLIRNNLFLIVILIVIQEITRAPSIESSFTLLREISHYVEIYFPTCFFPSGELLRTFYSINSYVLWLIKMFNIISLENVSNQYLIFFSSVDEQNESDFHYLFFFLIIKGNNRSLFTQVQSSRTYPISNILV